MLAVVFALALAGGLAWRRLARDVFPSLGVPTLYVAQPYGGMDAAQMEGAFAYYYEYHFLYITGIEHVESRSIQGASLMKLQFHPGTDMAAAMSETVAYVNRARAFMPPGTPGPFVMRFDAGSVAVGQLVFSTENPARTVGQMQDAALNLVRPLFATLPGVSAPPPFGGSARSIVVNAKPDRLRSYGVSPDELVQALAQGNLISPSGNLALGDSYPATPANAMVKSIKDLESIPVRVTPAGGVFIRDLATVEDAADTVTSYALVNGRRTVYMPVTKRADASTLSVVELVRHNLPRFQSVVPDDIRVSYEFDQSPVVERAIDNLVHESWVGALFTGLMVLAFLRDWRTALVVLVNIPLALLCALAGLWLCGQSLNLMTLGGLALAVGILVDEATVMVEGIHAQREFGKPLAAAALEAVQATNGPRFLALLCILSVFVPAFFMQGAAKALFVPMVLAAGFAMLASFLLSSTLAPVLSIWWLRQHSITSEPSPVRPARGALFYASVLRRLLPLRGLVAVGYLLLGGVGASIAVRTLGVEIFPSADSGQFALRLRATAGTRIEVTERLVLKALDLIHREAGTNSVALSLGLVGVHAPNYPVNLIHLWNSGPEEAHLSIQLKPGSGVAIPALRERLRAVFAAELPGVRCSFEPSDLVSRVMSFGSATPIEVAVSGPNLTASRQHAEVLLAKLRAFPELRDVQLAQELEAPTVEVNIQRERAGLMGVKVSDVTRSLTAATASSRFTVPNYWADPNTGVSYSLQVQVPQASMGSMEDVRNLPVAAGGRSVLLRQVAGVSAGTAVAEFDRYNMARVVSITANLENADLGRVLRKIEALPEVSDPKQWPAKSRVDVRGQAGPLRQLMDGFRSGAAVAVAVIFLLLSAYFQSARLALAAISTVPAVLCGALGMLVLTGTTLNIQSAMGTIMSVGVAVANAILLIGYAQTLRQGLSSESAEIAVAAACARVRPILMTSLAMMAGMVPLALGWGEGGSQTAPLGRAVLGGLGLATLATLWVLPSVLALLLPRAGGSDSLDPTDPESRHYTSELPAS